MICNRILSVFCVFITLFLFFLWSQRVFAASRAVGQTLEQQLQTLQQSVAQVGMKDAATAAASEKHKNKESLSQTTHRVPAPSVSRDDSLEAVLGGNDVRTEAFGKMLNTVLPLSPAQIRLLRHMYDATQKASSAYPGVLPRPTATSALVDLSPGATPPVVRLGTGFVTSVVFIDSTGAPWPIADYSLGNPKAFNVQWDKKSNILLIQAISAYRIANLAVILKGLGTPIMVTLSPGQAARDTRVDMRIPGLGPEAQSVESATLPGTESPALLSLLDGIPPAGAKPLSSTACQNCAWLVDKKLYLRTRFTVLSPAWISTIASADGTHVYEMQLTPLVLASYNGKTIQIHLKGF